MLSPKSWGLVIALSSLGTVACDDSKGSEDETSPGGKTDEVDGEVEPWTELPDAPFHFLHGALLPTTGEVLLYAGYFESPRRYPQELAIFDPDTGSYRTQPMSSDGKTPDLLCSHHVVQPDGRVIIMGGGGSSTSDAETWSWTFDPQGEGLTELAPMATPRWYPTALLLPDGRTLAASGTLNASSPLEVWDPAQAAWLPIAGSDESWPHLYPALHPLPNGDIFASRIGWRSRSGASRVFRFDDPFNGRWHDAASMAFPNRNEGTAVVSIDDSGDTPNTTIMVFGGGRTDSGSVDDGANPSSAEMIQIGDDPLSATWQRLPDMLHDRTNLDANILPDGRILIAGGRQGGKFSNQRAVMQNEIFDPATNTWEAVETSPRIRQYHMVSLLLPDGRIFVGGGIDANHAGPPAQDTKTAEFYLPSYFGATRPLITEAPSAVEYGASFEITTPDAARIESVVMLSASSITHHTDAGGRYVQLRIDDRADDRIRVRAPTSAGVLAPGIHMLFVVDEDRIPSVAEMVAVR